ncbi:glycyl-radical enzyme activating protein [Bacillota bacterium]
MKEQDTVKSRGLIFDIQKFSLHDGEGIRTLVFMKGCPLKCIWCSNPESHNPYKQIGYIVKSCIKCGRCYTACKQQAIAMPDYNIIIDRCNDCLDCAHVCMVGAKRIIGEEMTVEELIEIVEKDRIFYRNSKGGVTVGGGEPALQSDFVAELLKECKNLNIDTSIETCGHAKWAEMEKIVRHADVTHFDIKHMDSRKHLQLTGVDNHTILENAKKIGEYRNIIIRIPLIPGENDDVENLAATIRYISRFPKLIRLELLPYHNLGEAKYGWLGKEYALKDMKTYTKEEKERMMETVSAITGDVPIIII